MAKSLFNQYKSNRKNQKFRILSFNAKRKIQSQQTVPRLFASAELRLINQSNNQRICICCFSPVDTSIKQMGFFSIITLYPLLVQSLLVHHSNYMLYTIRSGVWCGQHSLHWSWLQLTVESSQWSSLAPPTGQIYLPPCATAAVTGSFVVASLRKNHRRPPPLTFRFFSLPCAGKISVLRRENITLKTESSNTIRRN